LLQSRAWLPCSGALPAAQASLIALPDELLRGILQRAWADRPPRVAAEEVRCAADLASVCRRVRALLRAQPLPLALDFSAAPLSAKQRRWLLDPAQAGRVEAAKFFGYFETKRDDLWEQPLLGEFLARHGGTLLRLSGVPHQLVACVSQNERPVLDLSGLRLTALGIDCYGLAYRMPWGDPPASMWLSPDRLPGTLEELHLVGLLQNWPGSLAWAQRPSAGLAGHLPRLQTLCVTRVSGSDPLSIKGVPLLEGFPVPPALEVDLAPASRGDVSWVSIDVPCSLFGRARSVRIVACGCLVLCDDQEDVAMFVDRLCPPGLQAAELCAEPSCIGLRSGQGGDQCAHEVVRELISRCGGRFAVEVGVHHERIKSGPRKATLRCLAWRRWPAPGAPGLPAARAAHERARAWAADP